ncbi:MAG TPA: biopolymer transporter ExbD [Steroidobacteraceae bacterium]|nr:biopolymer transporter ExbD [Steroidobacteraceae bacterium]HUO36451.1 biopolymer transporter ExbD [Mycobacterium sp.]
MSMNVQLDGEETGLNSTINTTPLVDVMLVLLIIFLITVPVINKVVPVHLPDAANVATQTKPENIVIAVDAPGNIYWNNALLSNAQELLDKVKEKAVVKPQPEIHIRADKDALYQSVGRVLYAIQRGGIVKVGFITQPDAASLAESIANQARGGQ